MIYQRGFNLHFSYSYLRVVCLSFLLYFFFFNHPNSLLICLMGYWSSSQFVTVLCIIGRLSLSPYRSCNYSSNFMCGLLPSHSPFLIIYFLLRTMLVASLKFWYAVFPFSLRLVLCFRTYLELHFLCFSTNMFISVVFIWLLFISNFMLLCQWLFWWLLALFMVNFKKGSGCAWKHVLSLITQF